MAASLDGFWVVSLAESTAYESVGEKAAMMVAMKAVTSGETLVVSWVGRLVA